MSPIERDSELLARLGFLVLLRRDDGQFERSGEPPLWFVRMAPEVAHRPEPLDLVQLFPFLDSFLPTAANYWGTRGRGRIRSGQWLSHYPSGEEVPLEASAICRDNNDLLLIEFNKSVYDRDKGYLQKARTNALQMERAVVLERALAAERRRIVALYNCFGGNVLRVDAAGRIVGGTTRDATHAKPRPLDSVLPKKAAKPIQTAITHVFRTGHSESIDGGWRVVPISDDECWVIEPPADRA